MEIFFTLKNGDRVTLTADELNYMICRPRTRKDKATGNVVEEWAPCKYYGSLSQALWRIIDMKVRSSDARSLKELVAEIRAAQEEIMAAWDPEVEIKVDIRHSSKREAFSESMASGARRGQAKGASRTL